MSNAELTETADRLYAVSCLITKTSQNVTTGRIVLGFRKGVSNGDASALFVKDILAQNNGFAVLDFVAKEVPVE